MTAPRYRAAAAPAAGPDAAAPTVSAMAVEAHALLDRFDALGGAAVAAAEAGDVAALDRAMAEVEQVIAALRPCLGAVAAAADRSRPGSVTDHAAPALGDALARRLSALVARNEALAVRVTVRQAELAGELAALEAEIAAAAAPASGTSPSAAARLDVRR